MTNLSKGTTITGSGHVVHGRFNGERVLFVNENVRSDPRTPFGGVKHSGYGRECSEFGIREFTNIKTVHVKPMGHGGSSGVE